MSRWKAPMPPEKPADGKAHFVFAMLGGGQRVELFGQLPMADVVKALHGLMEAQNATKRAAHPATKEKT